MAQSQQQGIQNFLAQGFNYSFSLASFQQVIASNFKRVQEVLMGQSKQISEIKAQMKLQKQIKNAEMQKNSEKQSNNVSQNQINTSTSSPLDSVNEKNKITEEKQALFSNKTEKFIGEGSVQSSLELSNPHLKNEVQVIQTKMFELFQRVRSLQERQLFSSRQVASNLREFQFSIMNANKLIEKRQIENQEINQQIQKLRNDLTEYKLKKESKINKILHANSLQQSQTTNISNDNYDYIAEKIQFLLKHVKQLLLKKTFEEEREGFQLNIENLRKKLNQTVSQTYLHQVLKNTELKIYQAVSKYIKAHQFTKQGARDKDNESQSQAENQSQLDAIITQGNRELNEKVSLHEQNIKKVTEKLQLMSSEIELNRKQRLESEQDWMKQTRRLEEIQRQLEKKIAQVDRFGQDMKLNLNQKHLQIENQIIDTQQNLEKIQSQLKTYSYSKQDLGGTFSSSIASPLKNNHERKDQDKLDNNPEIDQDITAQKKKVAKLVAKVQGLKQDILAMRQDFTRQIDGLKMGLEKKADWDSLKKGLNYFDEKIKQFKLMLQHLYESSQVAQNGESLAVKKGWTCLMCDRDIKNYEGKLGDIKFTSVFPTREASPRIGGYYKQQQSNQQYKQVFLNNPTYNRGKRIGSLRASQNNQSRQQLNT